MVGSIPPWGTKERKIMGVRYLYHCDFCGKIRSINIAPFEPSDPGEETPVGWKWQEEGVIACNECS